MTQEEAIKILKDFHDESALFSVRTALETLYPKFKESEGEKVRKALVEMVRDRTGDELWVDYNVHKEEVLAWLEKQGEKDKPTYNTYSKDVQLTQEEYDMKRVSDEATIKEVEAYKKGLEDAQKIFEKQGEQKPNSYSGMSFEYNGHTWGMCARDNGVDILCDKHIIGHLDNQGESYTKRDVDNAYLEGMAFAKNELEKQGEVESDNDDIEVEEKGIREAFNKIEDEKQCKQKPIEWDADDDEKLYFLKARLKDYEDCIIYDEELSEWQKNNVRETTKEFLEWLDSIKERMGG